ncbi:MAG: alpha/beta fold hydrolase [Bacteroidetes bacterium]|jgi:pimeloyl-ACP methyl ester carboxylesterase|nr:alpha/beta fold hydrolase [Bacteroidota bacterium]
MTSRIRFLAVLLLTGLAVPVQAQQSPTLEPYTFSTRDGREVEAEVGRFQVPENRSTRSDSTIELAFVRFPSTNPDPGSPIVYLAGGPGGSGSGTARGTRFDLFMALRDIADVIAFDQRGTGLSERLPDCPHRWTYPLDQPATREQLLDEALANARECAAYWNSQGVDLAAYNTNENADDLEALRQVLETDQISLWSISYGTHLALATIKRHPESIDRAILAGVEGPDHTYKLPSDQQAMLEKIDALVQDRPELREHLPSLLDGIETVLDRLERQPVTVELPNADTGEPDSVTVGPFDVQRITAAMLRGPESFDSLPKMVHDMLSGDFFLAAYLTRRMNRSGGLRAMSAAMDAASGMSAERRARYLRERDETLLGDAINFPYPDLADALGVPDLGPTFRAPVQSDVPVLLISGTLDGRTPVRNAEDVRAGFPNSTHLVLDGAGHSDPLFLSSPRILAMMKAFLQGEAVADTVITLPPVEFDPIETAEEVALERRQLTRYAGSYEVPGGDMEITVATFPEGLTITFSGRGTYRFYPTSETTFAMREAAVTVTFLLDEAGQVTGLQGNAQGESFEAVRQGQEQ